MKIAYFVLLFLWSVWCALVGVGAWNDSQIHSMMPVCTLLFWPSLVLGVLFFGGIFIGWKSKK